MEARSWKFEFLSISATDEDDALARLRYPVPSGIQDFRADLVARACPGVEVIDLIQQKAKSFLLPRVGKARHVLQQKRLGFGLPKHSNELGQGVCARVP